MTLKTHYETAMPTGALFVSVVATQSGLINNVVGNNSYDFNYSITFIELIATFVCFLAGTIYPDMDHEDSDLQPDESCFAWADLFEHRGICHTWINIIPAIIAFIGTLLFLQNASGTTYYVLSFTNLMSLGFIAGFLFHLILDSFTPMGIMWLFPVRFRLRIPIIKTDKGDKFFRIIYVMISVFACVYYWGNIVL